MQEPVVEGMQPPRGPLNDLHTAASNGLTARVIALVSTGEIHIDQANPSGATPLMVAAFRGHTNVVSILLNKGASTSGVDDDGFSALHATAEFGRVAVAKLLVKAEADLEAKTFTKGSTPLHLAAQQGYWEVVKVLIEAGANPNSRGLDGSTPLYRAAKGGHVGAVKVLLRAEADPLLVGELATSEGPSAIPLNIAAQDGHLGVVRELIQKHGVAGCGGASRGVDALELAAQDGHLEVMAALMSAGVVDTGFALLAAADNVRESAVKFLLQQMKPTARGERAAYLNSPGPTGQTPLFAAIYRAKFSSSRIVRLLVDAGVDAESPIRLTDDEGRIFFNDTPLIATVGGLIRKTVLQGKEATEDQIHSLTATSRLLLRLEAVHAASWLWTRRRPSSARNAPAAGGTERAPVPSVLSILRQRTRRPRVLLAAIFRWVNS